MSIIDWIKRKYCGFRYRSEGKTAKATAVFFSDGKETNVFQESTEQLAKELKPCDKSISELFAYLKAKYRAQPSEANEKRMEIGKAQIILNIYPDILSTPERKLPEKASRKEFLAWSENNDLRWQEALHYPMEKLGFVMRCCQFEQRLSMGKKITFRVLAEEKTKWSQTDVEPCVELSEQENAEVRNILDQITLYKGVSQSDIDKRTPRFLAYAAVLLEEEKKNA